MMIQESCQLKAERAFIEKLLQQLPETSVIERMSLESRKMEIEEMLTSQQAPLRKPTPISLKFRGKPIVGSYGMFADFGGAAVKDFADAVAAVGASQNATLGTRGALPNRENYQLLMTGTVKGSFGFVLEESAENYMLSREPSHVELAVGKTLAILKASIGTDEELNDAISEADPRALDALRKFLKTLADQEAICAIESGEEAFHFSDVSQIRRSENRLSQENIHEEDKTIFGSFQGVLPNRRTFEFRVEDSNEIITGKVSAAIEDVKSINDRLDQPVAIEVHTKKVGNSRRPTYVLLGYKESDGGEKA
ncbi:hypothetical protein [Methanoculleus sp. 7T]|jgi:hypothetical protein|uniref:hypothetical protein n=1 Tax=Methanoculleus sp. 7T TaxID=2937282 RepID=UPI0020C15BD5|nr:hypothetical protein [Methanoculleus sp. 7T]MCK8519067.1 hypothetical protein [Methanoculleus sp. 7T]